jgi:multidrug efflux pump subunit AcrB
MLGPRDKTQLERPICLTLRFLSGLVPRIPSMNMNIFSQVGLILLIGLVTKNSILLVEFANQQMAKGLDAKEAMLKAGLVRLRPILMTSLATIMGILPIAIGFGEAGESRRSLGVVAVGGMVTSTLLTLFVIPAMYSLLMDLGRILRGGRALVVEAVETESSSE